MSTDTLIAFIIARLEDKSFESLPNSESQVWRERFASAIRPGTDQTMVWPRFAHWLLTEEVPQYTKNKLARASLADVGALYREWIDGAEPSVQRWLKALDTNSSDSSAASTVSYAADAAYAAYAYAHNAKADEAAADAVDAAADAAADADPASASAARQHSYKRQADKLIKLLRDAPVKE